MHAISVKTIFTEMQEMKGTVDKLHSVLNQRCDLEGRLFKVLTTCIETNSIANCLNTYSLFVIKIMKSIPDENKKLKEEIKDLNIKIKDQAMVVTQFRSYINISFWDS